MTPERTRLDSVKTTENKNEAPISTRKYLQCTYSSTCQSSMGMELPVDMNISSIRLCCPICTDFRLTAIEATLQSLIGSASGNGEENDTLNETATFVESSPEKDTKILNPHSGESAPSTDNPSVTTGTIRRKVCPTHLVEFCHTKNCPDLHPKTCPDWLSFKRGCKLSKKKCSLQHSQICDDSWNSLTCFNKNCNKRHLAQTIRDQALLHRPRIVNNAPPFPLPNYPGNTQFLPQAKSRRMSPVNTWQPPPPPQNWTPNQYYAPHNDFYGQNFPPLSSPQVKYRNSTNTAGNLSLDHNKLPGNSYYPPRPSVNGPVNMTDDTAQSSKMTVPPPPVANGLSITETGPNNFLWKGSKNLQNLQSQMNALLNQFMES